MALFPSAPGGGQEVAHGYKGKGVLLHFVTDSNGRPIAVDSTAADGNEREVAKKMLTDLRTHRFSEKFAFVEADRGYDSEKLRSALLGLKYFPLIFWRKFRTVTDRPTTREMFDLFRIASQRWKIERFFSIIKRKYRRLLMRWERLQLSWLSFCKLALIAFWLF